MSDAKQETGMQGTAIAPGEPDRSLVLSSTHIDIVMGNIETLTQGFKSWMTEKVDYTRDLYGRNQSKPALLDPGTFKMMNFFRVRPKHDVLVAEVIREPGEELVKYVVAAKLVHHVTGYVLAEGVGSCSTDEKKYQYRWLTQSRLKNEHGYSNDEVERLSFKELPGKSGGMFKIYRIRNPEILDLDNTILKMAAKRCLGSTTPVLMKTSRSIVRTNLSKMYDNYLASSNEVYVPGTGGEWRKVEHMMREEGRTVYRVELADGSYMRSTEDHEFPTTEGRKLVKDLRVGDVLIREQIAFKEGEADPKYGWIVGVYLAEGYPIDDGASIRFTLNAGHTETEERIHEIATLLGARISTSIRKDSENTMDVSVYGTAFSGIMHQFINGKGA